MENNFWANDGIVSTASLVVGVAASNATQVVVIGPKKESLYFWWT